MTARLDFGPPSSDPLGVLASTAPVAQAGRHLRLDPAAVEAFAEAHATDTSPRHAEESLHATFLAPRRFLNYLLALEALNFSFWDDEPRWRVPYRGARHDGYWALAAALHRALTVDALPLWDARFLAGMTRSQLDSILRGEGRPVPLAELRLAHLREAGQVLQARWNGEFANLVAACGGEAMRLVRTIVAEFPSFRDEARWEGSVVRFYKRAQIAVADLARLLPAHPLGRLTGLERLTAFADYKLPQVLRAEGILVCSGALARKLDGGIELPAGSAEEVAIRAATIWGCEWLARALSARRGSPVMAMEVDYLLWSAGQRESGLPPYHRTRTPYY
jgi:hypothetical protein